MAKSKSYGGLIFLLVLVLGAGGGTWYYYKSKSDKQPEYTTVKVGRGTVRQAISATGTLQTTSQVTISSQVSGNVLDTNADFNDKVKAGQWLLKIDPSTYEQRLKQAKASFDAATANTVKIRGDTQRVKDLFNQNPPLVAKSEYDAAMAQLANAESNLVSSEAALANAETDLKRTVIYSPIDGVVLNRTIDKGATVNVNQSAVALFTIINDLSKLQISADVSEADIGNVQEGQVVEFAVDAYLNQPFYGAVTQVRNFAKNSSGVVTFSVIIDVDNANLRLKPGMTATANIIITERNDVLTIANNALRVRIPAELAEKMPVKTPAPLPGAPGMPPVAVAPAPAPTPTPEEIVAGVPPDSTGRRGGRGGRGGGGRGNRTGAAQNTGIGMNVSNAPRTLYKLVTDSAGKKWPEPVLARLGISNGTITQVVEGLAEGDTIITYVAMPGATATPTGPAATTGNPFQQGGRSSGGFRGGF